MALTKALAEAMSKAMAVAMAKTKAMALAVAMLSRVVSLAILSIGHDVLDFWVFPVVAILSSDILYTIVCKTGRITWYRLYLLLNIDVSILIIFIVFIIKYYSALPELQVVYF